MLGYTDLTAKRPKIIDGVKFDTEKVLEPKLLKNLNNWLARKSKK